MGTCKRLASAFANRRPSCESEDASREVRSAELRCAARTARHGASPGRVETAMASTASLVLLNAACDRRDASIRGAQQYAPHRSQHLVSHNRQIFCMSTRCKLRYNTTVCMLQVKLRRQSLRHHFATGRDDCHSCVVARRLDAQYPQSAQPCCTNVTMARNAYFARTMPRSYRQHLANAGANQPR